MPDDINCQVEECVYNDQTGGCKAPNIEVRSSLESRICETSENTCCQSFQPRE